MHVEMLAKETEEQDRKQSDESVERSGKLVLAALLGAAVLAAPPRSIVALNQSSERSTVRVTSGVAAPAPAKTASAPASVKPETRSPCR